MALEATLVIETQLPISVTVADGTNIPKGSILELNDNFTATITNGDTDPVIGIAAEEKIANDGKTQLAVYTRGIFRGFAGAAGVTFGMAIITDTGTGAANELVVADVNSEQIVGRALETATDTQSFLFELNPMGLQLA
jgi:hypothetical protein